MAYIKFKELSKYFDFKYEADLEKLPEYTKEYVESGERILAAYKNEKDYALFTNKKMILFDRDALAIYYKRIHIIPYKSISSSYIDYRPGKVDLLITMDSGYQLHLKFIDMHHNEKDNIKYIYKVMMKYKLEC